MPKRFQNGIQMTDADGNIIQNNELLGPRPFNPAPIQHSSVPGAAGNAMTSTYVPESKVPTPDNPEINTGDTGNGEGTESGGAGTTGGGTTGGGTGTTGGNKPSSTVTETPKNNYVPSAPPEYEKFRDYEGGNTGTGIESALGTQYSWDKEGTKAANIKYQQEVLSAKQQALANRQTIEQNSAQYQQQVDMMRYTDNQEAEKVGWTGGYVLDQRRQTEYLKASIQAQMYGAMELQKYGYDSALAAARLSYDLNQQEFAHKYYMDAVSVALQEAETTGTYISAEIRDMSSQYNTATQILNDATSSQADRERATQVKQTIDRWFSVNGLSKTGVETFAKWQAEQAIHMQEQNYKLEVWSAAETAKYNAANLQFSYDNLAAQKQQWQEEFDRDSKFQDTQLKQSAMDAANNLLDSNISMDFVLDANGEPIYDEETGSYKTIDFSKMSTEKIIEYAKQNSYTLEQVYGQVDTSMHDTVSKVLNQYATKDADGKITGYKEGVEEAITKAIKESKTLSDLQEILPGYTCESYVSDYNFTVTVDASGKINVKVNDKDYPINEPGGGGGPGGTEDDVIDENGIFSNSNSIKIYNLTSHFWKSGNGDDIEVEMNNEKYNITVADDKAIRNIPNGLDGIRINEFDSKIKELNDKYPNIQEGNVVFYENRYWICVEAPRVDNKYTPEWRLILEQDQDEGTDSAPFIEALKKVSK